MEIKKRYQIIVTFFILIAILFASSIYYTVQQMDEAMERNRIANEIVKDVFELTTLSHDYMMYHEERPKTQWLLKNESLGKLLKQASEEFKDSEEKAILEDINQIHESLEAVFSQLVNNYEKMNLMGEENATLLELEERLIGLLSVKSISIVTLAFQLSELCQEEMIRNHERVYDLTMIFILLMGAIMVITSYGVSRSVLKPIRQFQKGTEIIAEGNLDYQIGITKRDEIGDLARSFDNMRVKVKDRTTELKAANQQMEASNQQLRASEQQLKASEQALQKADESTRRKNAVLKAINKIFLETLVCESEEDVAYACITEAEVLTGSEFGLIGEINEADRFDTLSYGDLGWAICQMPESKAITLSKNMEIGGIWGQSILQEESQIINDPASHPAQVGIPEGHPPINSFMGIPLKHAGKTIGMIGLANKEGGYDSADQEAAESLSVALVEALRGKQAEEALRASEVKFRQFFENEPSYCYMISPEGEILDVNSAALKALGYRKEELVGKPLKMIYAPESRPRMKQLLVRWKETGELRNEEMVISPKEGDKRTVLLNVGVVKDKNGNVLHSVSVQSDITERKKAEKEKKALEAQLRQSQKLESIGTLAGGVAHEINNPLMGIISYAELIHDRIQDEKLQEFANGIIKEGNRVGKIVKNLLSFARQDKQSHSPASIEDILDSSLTLIGAILRKNQITIEKEIPDNLPKVKCRSQQIEQVILNLLTNARDALNERYDDYHEDKIIMISIRPFDKEGNKWIRTTIEDHGTGIPPEIIDRIFDPFFTTKSRAKGTGLGLSVSYGIIKDHNGELSVESEPGKYTRFHVDLRMDNGWSLEDSDNENESQKEKKEEL